MSSAAQKSPETSQAAALRKPAPKREVERGPGRAGGSAEAALALQGSMGNRAVTELLRGSSGRPLDRSTRREMEAKFGADFGEVRVHTGEMGAQVALGAGARAVTSGRNIAFSEGFYAPGRSEGKRLIAHELAHVMQQGRWGGRSVSKGSAEAEARQAATDVTGGRNAAVGASASGAQADPLTDAERRQRTESMLSPQLMASIAAVTTPKGQGGAPEQQKDSAAPPPPPPTTFDKDIADALKNGPPRDPNKVHWLGNPATQPSWTKGMTYSKDARGNTTVGTPELGETKFDPSGKRLTPVPNGDAEKIARSFRAMNYLQQTGGKRVVEGKGALDEAGWKQHIEERKQALGADVERGFTNLSEGERLFHKTQTGVALAAAIPAHALGGRGLDDSQKIVSGARQDIQIAKHQMDMARTPEELAEAEKHLQFVVGNAQSQFTRYKEDVYRGAENTITGIKVGAAVAVSGAALATPALLAAGGVVTAKTVGVGALAGGGFSTARQIAEIHDKTRKDFSFGEVGTGMLGGAAMGFVPGAAPLLMGPAVASSADEFSKGHLATGAVDAFGAVAPIGAAKAAEAGTGRSLGNYLRPRAAAMLMRAGQGIEDVPGLGGRNPTASIPREVPTMTQGAASEPIATPRPAVSESVATGKPGVTGSADTPTAAAHTVDPVPQASGEGASAQPSRFSPAPAEVGDAAFRARMALTTKNAMRANIRNTVGAGGEAAQLTSGVSTGIDLNAVSKNHPQIDTSSRDTFTSVKAYGVGKPLADSTKGRYDKEVRALRTAEEPGVPTKLGDAANRLAANRQAIQAAGAWPRGLARNATPEQIAKFMNQKAEVAIPSDHVAPMREYLAERARANPEAYGLKQGPGLEKGIQRLVQRVQPLGLTSEELAAMNKEVFGK